MEPTARLSANLKQSIEDITIKDLRRIELVEKYILKGLIGEGGFGKVFKIIRKKDKQPFAAKFIAIEDMPDMIVLEGSYNVQKSLKDYIEREISYLSTLKS